MGTALAAKTNCTLCSSPGGRLVEQASGWRVVAIEENPLPGFHRLICSDHVQEWRHLAPAQRQEIGEALAAWEHRLTEQWQPDKFNLASFGNVVPHLHWHLMPRWRTDPWWPNPIWASPPPACAIEGGWIGDWSSSGPAARVVRQAVFVQEQQVASEDEWDAWDAVARHAVMERDQAPVATGRLLSLGDGRARIGRMSVLQGHRGRGLGSALLAALLEDAQRLEFDAVVLHAQEHAIGFYQRAGFTTLGSSFEECNMRHQLMLKTLEGRHA